MVIFISIWIEKSLSITKKQKKTSELLVWSLKTKPIRTNKKNFSYDLLETADYEYAFSQISTFRNI